MFPDTFAGGRSPIQTGPMTIPARIRQLLTPSSALRDASGVDGPVRALPWTVSYARSGDDFRDALRMRAKAYGRHFGGHDSFEANIDEHDFASNAFVLIARAKDGGEVVGTMRVAFGVNTEVEMLGFHPKPEMLSGVRLGEARRLSLKPWRMATLVKLSLWKSFYLSCEARGVEKMLIAARPPMNDDYRMLLFEPAMPGGAWFEPGSVPDRHEILMVALQGLRARFEAHSTELHRFMCVLKHPDIEVIEPTAVNPVGGWSARSMLTSMGSAPDLGFAVR